MHACNIAESESSVRKVILHTRIYILGIYWLRALNRIIMVYTGYYGTCSLLTMAIYANIIACIYMCVYAYKKTFYGSTILIDKMISVFDVLAKQQFIL
jgi:hypothetical protein